MSISKVDLFTLYENLEKLPHDKFVVAFYINNTNVSQDEWMRPLARCLREHGHYTIGLTTPDSRGKCRIDTCDIASEIYPESVKDLERVNVFIISDMDYATIFPAKSRVLGCAHAFNAIADTDFRNQMHFVPTLDGWMTSFPISELTRQKANNLLTGFCTPDACARKSHFFHIIPAGYPRMAALVGDLAQAEHVPDSIIFGPVGIKTQMQQGGNYLRKYGINTVRVLLTNFPGMNVIFRPYKTDRNSREVSDICSKFKNEERFIYDGSDERLFAFSRGAILVTDFSHIGQSFSFATLRPTIYFYQWNTKKSDGHSIFMRNEGYQVSSFSDLVASIQYSLAHADKIALKIRKLRDRLVLPFENSFDNIAEWLRDFYEDRPRKEWLSIPRKNPQLVISEMDLASKLLSLSGVGGFAAATMFRRPYSPLLAAITLHKGSLESPDSNLWTKFKKIVGELLRKEFSASTYKDVPKDDIKNLYSLALISYIKENKATYEITMIENLLKEIEV